MKLSISAALENAPLMAEAGFDCIDVPIGLCASARIPEDKWKASLAAYEKSPLPLAGSAGLFPGDLPLTGPKANLDDVMNYLKVTIARAAAVGVTHIVFGSGVARNVPEGFDMGKALDQVLEISKRMADLAANANVTIVLETLHHGETNTFNTIAAGALLVNRVNHPSFKLLTDYYHFAKCDNDLTSLVMATPLIRHTHIATAEHRRFPGMEYSDFSQWMHVLKAGGYDGVIAIEGGGDFNVECLRQAATVLREAWEKA